MKNLCFHLNRKVWVTIAMLLTLALPSLAQTITVTGHVADEYGEDLIGATIMQKGTTNGTSADIDGNFSINVPSNATLVVSYVGYDPMDIAVNGQTSLNIVMKQNATVLQETVVIGYGSVKKSDATGSVAIVTPDDVEAGISTSAQDLLVGASPGVTVTTNGGDPTGNANIRIRGGSSLSASNNPLIVIDGVPQSNMGNSGGTNALTMLNPSNIESMTILKDASATAIYGSRASNGVIIITTKKGKMGRPQVNFAANFHVNTARKTLKMMNSSQYIDIMEQYGSDRAKSLMYALSRNSDPNGEYIPYDTDWQKEILRTSFSHDYSLSVGGSAGKVPYRVNASFAQNDGIIKTSSMQRTTVGFSLTPKFFNDQLSITANANGTYSRTKNPGAGDQMGGAVAWAPVVPVHMDYPTNGTLYYDFNKRPVLGSSQRTMFNGFYQWTEPNGKVATQASSNPVGNLYDHVSLGKTLSSTGNLQIDYALYWVPELHFNLNLGYSVSKTHYTTDNVANSRDAWNDANLKGAGTFFDEHQLIRNTLLDFYINYKKYFEAAKSDLDVMVGYSWQRFDYTKRNWTHVNTLGYYTDQFTLSQDGQQTTLNWFNNGTYNLYQDPATADAIGKPINNAPVYREGNINQLVSFFGRINYVFDDTYLLTFTLRDDGTSRFSKDNRWGLFPSVALGWKINNMPFMERASGWLSDFKLRLGWGETGQQEMDGMYFPYIPTYVNSTQNGFQYLDPNGSGEWINPLYPNAYNPDLKWETTTTWNVGLDMSFLNNRITLAADWYLRDTRDLLSYVPTGAVNTANKMWRNIGSMRNIGVEATITAKPVVTNNFTWSTSFNVAWNKNKITELEGGTRTAAIGLPSGKGGSSIGWHIEGEPAFTFLCYEQVYDDNGDPIENMYVDQNQDGVINENDLIKYHSKDPKVTMAWNNNFQWKNWDLGITLRANLGNYVYNNLKYENSRVYDRTSANYQLTNLLSNTTLFYNAASATNLPFSSYFVENASFLRCDNITLGYTFRDLIQGNLTLRIFAAVQNPFVITTFSGIDPEEFGGVQNNPYPRPITTSLGIVANF